PEASNIASWNPGNLSLSALPVLKPVVSDSHESEPIFYSALESPYPFATLNNPAISMTSGLAELAIQGPNSEKINPSTLPVLTPLQEGLLKRFPTPLNPLIN
ncbi:unnamed protein product, partial [Protopolystoma xenopodis]